VEKCGCRFFFDPGMKGKILLEGRSVPNEDLFFSHLSKNDVDEQIYLLSDNVVLDLFKFVFKGAKTNKRKSS